MKIKCLLVMPGVEVQNVRIPANYKFIKSLIGENLGSIKLKDNALIILNRNPQEDSFNRVLGDKVIRGAFLVIGTKKDYRKSLNKKQTRKYSNMFKLKKHEKKITEMKDEYYRAYYTELQKKYLQEYKPEYYAKVA